MISKFRLCCNPTLSFKTNLADVLLTTSFFILSSRPQNIACHNLCTSHTPPKFYRHVLGLGLKFCPRPAYTTSPNIVKQTTSRFRKDIYTKVLFCHLDNDWNEKQLYIRDPEWDPPSDNIPIEIRARISHFNRVLLASFKHRKVGSNLSTPQQQCLTALRNNKDLLVIPSDKNLGPVILDRDEYVRRCFQEHLLTDNYKELSEHEANTFVQHTYTLLTKFINDHANSFTEPDLTFLLRSLKVDDPFAYFYALAKVHKKPWVTRPIVSVAGSITHGIGRWLDQQLQPIVRQLPTYLKSSFQLKTDLDQLPDVNSNHMSFFTGDIVAMYPSIDIPDALRRISQFLQTSPLAIHCPKIAIISALEIIMTRNCFRFGNTYWLQLDGTAMGTPQPQPSLCSTMLSLKLTCWTHSQNSSVTWSDTLMTNLVSGFITQILTLTLNSGMHFNMPNKLVALSPGNSQPFPNKWPFLIFKSFWSQTALSSKSMKRNLIFTFSFPLRLPIHLMSSNLLSLVVSSASLILPPVSVIKKPPSASSLNVSASVATARKVFLGYFAMASQHMLPLQPRQVQPRQAPPILVVVFFYIFHTIRVTLNGSASKPSSDAQSFNRRMNPISQTCKICMVVGLKLNVWLLPITDNLTCVLFFFLVKLKVDVQMLRLRQLFFLIFGRLKVSCPFRHTIPYIFVSSYLILLQKWGNLWVAFW